MRFIGLFARSVGRLAVALLATYPVQAQLVIDSVGFHNQTNLSYDGSSPTDDGGGLFVIVRNSGPNTITLSTDSLTINGAGLGAYITQGPSAPTPGWARVWPTTVPAGGVTTFVVKTLGGTIVEGATLSAVTVSHPSGSATLNNVPLITPPLRLANLIPSQDYRTLYLYLRNDGSEAVTVTSVYLNGDVTPQCTFVGGNVVAANGGIGIVKVSYANPVPLLTPFGMRVNGTRLTQGAVTVSSFVRLTEPTYMLATWGSSPATNEARIQRLRTLYGLGHSSWGGWSSSQALNFQRYNYRRRILDLLTIDANGAFSGEAWVTSLKDEPTISCWFIEDEPDLSYSNAARNPRAMMRLSRRFWELDPNTPTTVNLVSSRSAQGYALGVDHPAIDAYMQYAPRHYTTLTYNIDEALEQTENLKANSEPIRTWMTPQGISPGTWSPQPNDWGIGIQFWAQVMGGAKGLDGFKFDDTLASDPQTQKIVDCIRQLRLVENLIVYGEKTAQPTNKTMANCQARMLVSEHAVVVPVVNLQASYNALLDTTSKTDQTGVALTINVPAWIPVTQVKEVTPTGLVDVAHTVAGQQVTISGLTVVDARVFLIGAADSEPPAAPSNPVMVTNLNGTGQFFSWMQPHDNFGVAGYRVYENGVEIANVPTPAYAFTPAAGCSRSYTVRAYDGAGNLGPASSAVITDTTRDATAWSFDAGDEGWAPQYDISALASSSRVLVIQTADGPGLPNGSTDAYCLSPGINVPAASYRWLYLRMKNETPNSTTQFFWSNSNGENPGAAGQPVTLVHSTNDAAYKNYVIDLAGPASWTSNITALRMDPANGSPGRIRFDAIQLAAGTPSITPWYFDTAGDTEGWIVGGDITGMTATGGALSCTTGASDPILFGPNMLIPAALYRYVLIRMRNQTSATQAQLYFSRTDSGMDGSKVITFSVTPNDTQQRDYWIDMGALASWTGTINQLRLDPPGGGTVQIDQIRIAASNTVNQAPSLSVPGPQNGLQGNVQTPITGLLACDGDLGPLDEISVSFSVNNGTVRLTQSSGLLLIAGANGSPTMTWRGRLATINTALNTALVYTGNALFNGSDTLTVTVNDLGSGKSFPGPLTDVETISLNVASPTPTPNASAARRWTVME